MIRISRRQTLGIACALLAALPGCGGGFDYGATGKVTGRLTLEGKPMSAGHAVKFMDRTKGFLAYGLTDAEGNFTITSWNEGNMPIGKYTVSVAPPEGKVKVQELTPEQRFNNPELLDSTSKLEFPVKFANETSSGLEYEVKAGENRFEIDLPNQPAKK